MGSEKGSALPCLFAPRIDYPRMRVPAQHRSRPQQVVDVLVATDIPHAATGAALQNGVVVDVADAAAREESVGLFDQGVVRLIECPVLCHSLNFGYRSAQVVWIYRKLAVIA